MDLAVCHWDRYCRIWRIFRWRCIGLFLRFFRRKLPLLLFDGIGVISRLLRLWPIQHPLLGFWLQMLYGALYITGQLLCPNRYLGGDFFGDTNGIFIGFLFLALVFSDFCSVDGGVPGAFAAASGFLTSVVGVALFSGIEYLLHVSRNGKCVPNWDALGGWQQSLKRSSSRLGLLPI